MVAERKIPPGIVINLHDRQHEAIWHSLSCLFFMMEHVPTLLHRDRLTGLGSSLVAAAWLVLLGSSASGQTDLPIYRDELVNGFQDWSWGTRNFSNTSPVHSGSKSIRAELKTWEAISVARASFDSSPYGNFSFWIHGGTTGGQRLQLAALINDTVQTNFPLPALHANTWRHHDVPLSLLRVENKTNVYRFWLQLTSSGTSGTFYLDDIQLGGKPIPNLVNVAVQSTNEIRTVDSRWFAVNTAIWDSHFDTPTTISLMQEAGIRALRFPGGSLSDEYHWATGKSGTNTWKWVTSFANFIHVATNVGAEIFITVNYGSGTAAEAAGWVRHANLTNKLGVRYWEIGNENYGPWETDFNTLPHHAYTYAARAKDYMDQMRAADPTIKVGVVVAPGEDSYHNDYADHPVVNPRTGKTHNGWTPILLKTLKELGAKPDFLVHHHYPQWTGQESDPLLLQSTFNWAQDAADMRQQVRDYYGTGGDDIEMLVTENNSNSGDQGKQSTSLVNGLYYTDSFGRLAQTEFNAFVWWDWRNGTDTSGRFDDLLYGWRTYGDLGMVNGLAKAHPTYYAAKILQHFVKPGDRIIAANTDFPLLSAYAARSRNGGLSLLVLNKDLNSSIVGRVNLAGYGPGPEATMRMYGIPQDDAARTNAIPAHQDISFSSIAIPGSLFERTFPPLSISVINLVPEAPTVTLQIQGIMPEAEFVLTLHGQPGVTYVIENSRDMQNWTAVSTNTLSAAALDVRFSSQVAGSNAFWRASWRP